MAPAAVRNGVSECPELEVIAAFLDHRLTERERATVTEHLASCEACYFVFTEAAQMRSSDASRRATEEKLDDDPRPVWNWRSSKILWSSAAGLAAAASLVLAIGTGMIPFGGDSSDLRTLVAAVGTDRPFEPRVSGGFAYGPVRPPTRGVDPAHTSPDIRIAVASIEKEAARRETVRTLHELGIAYLISDDLPRAITTLEHASNRSPSARLLSDLAAAYLVRGARENRPQDLSRALTLANRAVERDPTMREALFNRALALDRLSIFDDARQAWQAYLRVDDQSAWAAEAKNNLQKLGGN